MGNHGQKYPFLFSRVCIRCGKKQLKKNESSDWIDDLRLGTLPPEPEPDASNKQG